MIEGSALPGWLAPVVKAASSITVHELTRFMPPEGSDAGLGEILFIGVPEEKVVKNRLHLDLRPDDQAAEVARFERLGAHRVDVGQSADVTWVVLADQEGNEFCVLQSKADAT